MYPAQEDSLAKARVIKEAWREQEGYLLPAAEWEQIVVDLVSLIETLRPQGDPPDAVPGTVRALLYELNEITMRYPEMMDAVVNVDDTIGGQRPVTAVEQCNFDVSLQVDAEFWDAEIHPGLLIDLESPEVLEELTSVVHPARMPRLLKTLVSLHEKTLDQETGR